VLNRTETCSLLPLPSGRPARRLFQCDTHQRAGIGFDYPTIWAFPNQIGGPKTQEMLVQILESPLFVPSVFRLYDDDCGCVNCTGQAIFVDTLGINVINAVRLSDRRVIENFIRIGMAVLSSI
jgi:hypothetical protein